ncbi:MAG: hypothetical protein CML24_11630 [Rhizobiales bacterium]|jgi:hypothetical protein|nr:hypothetical protein [Hyphomicrobiales bacterium]|tara:strand:+ start:24028 stop:24429 length:402 start_codon:yes stop_codon:yes gene_type:complete
MPAYLLSDGDTPISVAEIKLELGLEGNDLDGTIQGGIASAVASFPGCKPQIWRIECDERFDFNLRIVGKTKRVGQEQIIGGKPYREVITTIDPAAIRKAKAWIMRWCANQMDIHEALVRQSRNERAAFAVAAE